MDGNEAYRVLPRELPQPPVFRPSVSPWGTGCLVIGGAFVLAAGVSGAVGENSPAVPIIVFIFLVAGVGLSFFIHKYRKEHQVYDELVAWSSSEIKNAEAEANE